MNIKTYIKVFLCILVLLGGNTTLFAQQDSYYITPDIDDTTADSKRALAVYRMVFRNNPPTPKAGINDWEKTLTAREEQQIDSLITDLRKTVNIDIAIITLDTLCIRTEKFAEISSRIADKWGVGKKQKRRGLLLSFSAGHKQAIIENGAGEERLISETQAKIIQDQYLYPLLSEGRYYEAMAASITAIGKILAETN